MNLDNRQLLLNQLADGAYHSGETLGEKLGVSRAAIWKQLSRLDELGLELERCKRRGYRIPGGLSLLDSKQIEQSLSEEARTLLRKLEVHQQLASTNDLAMQAAQRAPATGSVYLAEMQTAGKGRRGRTWVSPYGRNIYMSAVRGYSGGVAAVEGLSLAVGVVLVEALEALGIDDLGLKWPNDLLWQGRKLGGVLLEITGDPAGVCEVVVGIGINVQMAAGEAKGIDQQWVNLAEIRGAFIERNQVASAILNALLPMLARYESHGFAQHRDAWLALDALAGKPVELLAGESRIAGIARGVDSAGSLRLETESGVKVFSGGEISVRQPT